jgi:hypothetical protein
MANARNPSGKGRGDGPPERVVITDPQAALDQATEKTPQQMIYDMPA